jgi:DNA-binding MarR family transcriptional regulator
VQEKSELADVVRGSIGGLLRRTYARFTAEAVADSRQASEFVLLSALADASTESQRELAERLGINRTIMVRLVDGLVSDGYVLRQPNPSNRRASVLSLTPAGRSALGELRASVESHDARVLRGLSGRERQRLKVLLGKLLPSSARIESTGHLVAQAHFRLRRMGDARLSSLGLRTRHFASLGTLARLEPCQQQMLASELGISEPAAAQVVEELVQAGLVSRGADPTDRRRYALTLTALGRERVVEVADVSRQLQGEIRSMLGEAGDAELRALLEKLLAA